eukprot:563631-Prymnesium_polylepis.1
MAGLWLAATVLPLGPRRARLPWSVDDAPPRMCMDGRQDLSVDELMRAMAAERGEAVENEAELRAAFKEALKEVPAPPPADPRATWRATRDAIASGSPLADDSEELLKSGVLRGAASLAFELRSLTRGARGELELLQSRAAEKIKCDAILTARVADWALRRAVLDTGRALGAAKRSLLSLGPAAAEAPGDDGDEEEAETEAAAPFASRLRALAAAGRTQLRASDDGQAAARWAAAEEAERTASAEEEAERMMAEAHALAER